MHMFGSDEATILTEVVGFASEESAHLEVHCLCAPEIRMQIHITTSFKDKVEIPNIWKGSRKSVCEVSL